MFERQRLSRFGIFIVFTLVAVVGGSIWAGTAGAYEFCGKYDLLLLRTLIADDGKSANF